MQARKRLYLGLALVSLLIALLLLGGFWFLILSDWVEIQRHLLIFTAVFLTILFLLFAVGIGAIIFTLWTEKPLLILQNFIRIAINLFFPLIISIGKLFDVKKEAIEYSFLEVNNQLVRNKKLVLLPERTLILLPHCLQKASCTHKITIDIQNCQRCGACKIGELISIAEEYQVHLAVATGGTAARKVIQDLRPKTVIAVACERDLISGIQDAYPLPVLGILNERPQGPCYNTSVDVGIIRKYLDLFLKNT